MRLSPQSNFRNFHHSKGICFIQCVWYGLLCRSLPGSISSLKVTLYQELPGFFAASKVVTEKQPSHRATTSSPTPPVCIALDLLHGYAPLPGDSVCSVFILVPTSSSPPPTWLTPAARLAPVLQPCISFPPPAPCLFFYGKIYIR